ncbi:putative ureidoglycolate amidohydrolase [Rosa chinensis]|uniref:Putative ureidoglycolate amidohydrolase n=1 Tax=Rosa chinensis TaxID=74649 RepID=A0A2P6QQA7_ROSCH|nr:putative ureidoglycolate amidohydrolase [Rosa chinensis]
MPLRLSVSALTVLFFFFFLCSFTAILAHNNEDPTIKTMEDFSGYPIHESHSHLSSLSVDAQSLQKQIDELSSFSDTPAPSVTRVLYTEKDVLARRFIKNLMGLSGLSVREDAVGNIFGRWEGSNPELSAVATGSHIDAIPYSGKYDGVVGVLGAIEAINVLTRSGFKPKRSLEVIMFTSEEPTRFGISCLGRFGSAPGHIPYHRFYSGNCRVVLWFFFCSFNIFEIFFTLPPSPFMLILSCFQDFSTVINDAGLAAAELALAVERHVLESGSIDTVGTVGILELHPGAINSIPSKSHLEIDTRDIDEERRNTVIEKIHQSAISIARKRRVTLSEFKIVNRDPPALSEKSILDAMVASSKELNLTHKLMISRAYHDSLFMARISPMGMIFIPCYKGYSHKPEEYSSTQDISNGVKVLALTLAKLSLQ